MTGDVSGELVRLAADLGSHGVRRLHVLAWRDLDDLDAGGSEVHADHFMRRFAAAGLDVTHRTSAAAGRAAEGRRNGYRVVRRGGRETVFPRVVVAETLRGMGRFDAVIEIWNGVPWLTPIWCRRPRLTFVHHVHGPMWDQVLPRPLAAAGRAFEARAAPRLYRRERVLTPSEATRAELVALGLRFGRVTVVPNGVDEVFRPGGRRHAAPTVLGVGRLAPVKRFDRLVEAAVVARSRVPDLRLEIVGDGPERQRIEALVARHGAQDWVELAGRMTPAELVARYRSAWVVASASLAEGWGLTLTEAAACATPAVATDIGGHRSSVVDGVTGILAPLEGLGDAIADLVCDHARRAALGAAASRRAHTLTWDSSALAIMRALHAEVITGRGPGRRAGRGADRRRR